MLRSLAVQPCDAPLRCEVTGDCEPLMLLAAGPDRLRDPAELNSSLARAACEGFPALATLWGAGVRAGRPRHATDVELCRDPDRTSTQHGSRSRVDLLGVPGNALLRSISCDLHKLLAEKCHADAYCQEVFGIILICAYSATDSCSR